MAVVATFANGTPLTVTGVVRATPPVNVPNPLTATAALTATGAENVDVAWTVRAWLLPPLSVTLPLAVIAVLAVKAAVEAKLLAALTVRVCADVVPRTVLPAAVRVLAVLLRVTLPAKVARPVLSMVRRSVSWPVLPGAVVLRMRLPPQLPVASCSV